MALDTPIHLKQTQAFIDERPVEVVIHRNKKEAVASGGHKWVHDRDLDPQTLRKLGSSRVRDLTARTTVDGSIVTPSSVCIAMPDTDVQRGDTFILDGILHEVVWVSDLPEWRRNIEVYEHA